MRNNIRTLTGILVIAISMGISSQAYALSLEEAKSQGWVGESTAGYLETVKPGNPQAEAVKNDVNQKRRQKYREISSKNGTSVTAVERLAGQKAIELSPSGQFIKDDKGAWRKK